MAARLCRIPPDWDAAEKHGKANLVVDRSKSELDLDDPSSFCQCGCDQPYSTEFYDLCSDNETLGELGPGFPLYFEFIKHLGYISLVLTIIYFIPCAGLMAQAYQKIKEKDPDAKVLAVYSFGAFVK